MTLDLTKPMRWKSGNPINAVWIDDSGALVDRGDCREWVPRNYLEHHAEKHRVNLCRTRKYK